MAPRPDQPSPPSSSSWADQDIIVVCQAGYASSLAAASLRQLGLSRATDLIGGYEAWAEAGLPTRPQRAAEAPMGSAPAR